MRRLAGSARLGNYLSAAASGTAVDGAESELLDALELRGGLAQPGAVQIPLMLLADEPAPEARAATTTGEYGGPTMQRPILQRLFGPSLFDMLGVRLDTVPMGRSEWPLISAGVAPVQTAEDADAPAAVPWTVGPQTLRPKAADGTVRVHGGSGRLGDRPGTSATARTWRRGDEPSERPAPQWRLRRHGTAARGCRILRAPGGADRSYGRGDIFQLRQDSGEWR